MALQLPCLTITAIQLLTVALFPKLAFFMVLAMRIMSVIGEGVFKRLVNSLTVIFPPLLLLLAFDHGRPSRLA
jgi:hypothetical protein